MKRLFIAATVAAMTIPIGLAAPAHAFDPDTAGFSADNSSGTERFQVKAQMDCSDTTNGNPTNAYIDTAIDAGSSVGMTPSCVNARADVSAFWYHIGSDEMFAAGSELKCFSAFDSSGAGHATLNGWANNQPESSDRLKSSQCPETFAGGSPAWLRLTHDDTTYNIQIMSNDPAEGQGFVWDYYKARQAKLNQSNNVSNTADVNTGTVKSKNTGYVTRNPNRVTAMAKRFVDEPNSPINIHAYGPDRDVALARAKHVREHLQSEITRLGGDPANYPTFVTYAGNPDHKKDVHVTIHQHSVRGIGTSGW